MRFLTLADSTGSTHTRGPRAARGRRLGPAALLVVMAIGATTTPPLGVEVAGAAGAGTISIDYEAPGWHQWYRGQPVGVYANTTSEIVLSAPSLSGVGMYFTIRPPVGALLGTGSFLADRDEPDPVFGQLTVEDDYCADPAPSVVQIDDATIAGTTLVAFRLRFRLGCDAAGRTIFARVQYPSGTLELDRSIDARWEEWRGLALGGQSSTQRVKITNRGTAPLEVTDILTSESAVRFVDTCNGPLTTGQSCNVDVYLKLSADVAAHPGWVEIRDSTSADLGRGVRIWFEVPKPGPQVWFTDQVVNAPALDGIAMPIVGDFDGDRVDDNVLWWGPAGADDSMWDPSTGLGSTSLSLPWSFGYWAIPGNFDGDAKSEVIFYGIGSRADVLWTFNGTRSGNARALSIPGNTVPFVGDFDGNDVDDVLWFDPTRDTHRVTFFRRDGTLTTGRFSIPRSTDDIIVADLDDQPGTELLLWNAQRKVHAVLHPNGRTLGSRTTIPAPVGAIPVPIELDATSPALDLLWWTRTKTTHRLALSAQSHRLGRDVPAPGGSVPIVANYDGDETGWSDVLWYRRGQPESISKGTHRGLRAPTSLSDLRDLDAPWIVVGRFDSNSETNSYSLFEFTPGWGAVDIFWWAHDIEIAPTTRASTKTAPHSVHPSAAGVPPSPSAAPRVRR